MKIKSMVAAAAIALSSFGAFAGNSTFADGVAYFNNDPLTPSSAFSQSILFTGLAAGLYDIVGTLSGQNLNFSTVVLDGAAWDVSNYNGKSIKFGNAYLEVTADRPVTLTLSGTTYAALSSPAYSGSITVTAIPEPETFAMLLAGLGLVGTIARRRKLSATASA